MGLTADLYRKPGAWKGARRLWSSSCAPYVHRRTATAPPLLLKPRPDAQRIRQQRFLRGSIQLMKLRSYAALSGTVPLSLDEASRSIAEPHILAGCRNVQLTMTGWQKWQQGKPRHDPRCHSKLSHVLAALDSSPHVDGVFLHLSDVLALPLEIRKHPDHHERTPATIFGSIAIEIEPVDLGKWLLPHYPSVSIGDPVILRIMQEARKHNGNPSAWHQIVAKSGPTYQAFDFTAAFHSLDLRINSDDDTAIGTTLVDFGPYGLAKCRTENLDLLSVCFADDMSHNARYFERGNAWHPNLYDELRSRGRGVVYSRLLHSSGSDGK
ncbi:hypothetical protein B0J12DRAFT_697452 [Macrophomina phaseolina]|uniref:Uncharacterized protein n=1 Tax=Macrophomina phaseolina TaxID=35725 RepID=A0ABQ8GJD1_9PEZI|nr:hypothetical protein B0J12DRAFT_697452 [Macrophomina phaseolina]